MGLAKVNCGAVLSRIEGRATFRLGTPQLLTVETGDGPLCMAIGMGGQVEIRMEA